MTTLKQVTLAFIFSVGALGSCLGVSIGATFWMDTRQLVFTIPNDYEGFLAISYSCSQGVLLDQSTRTFSVAFPANGAVCIENAYEGGPYRFRSVRTHTNQAVPVVLHAETATGYALIDRGFMSHQQPGMPERAFTLYWAGDMQRLAALLQNGGYGEELATFLEKNYGISRNGR